MPHHVWVSYLIIGLTINAITVTITVKGQPWRLLIYALSNFLLCHNIRCFQKQPPLFLKVSEIPQENNCAGVSFFFEMMKLYKGICSGWIKVDLHSVNVISHTNDTICWWMFCLNLYLRQMKCSFYVTNLLFY